MDYSINIMITLIEQIVNNMVVATEHLVVMYPVNRKGVNVVTLHGIASGDIIISEVKVQYECAALANRHFMRFHLARCVICVSFINHTLT